MKNKIPNGSNSKIKLSLASFMEVVPKAVLTKFSV